VLTLLGGIFLCKNLLSFKLNHHDKVGENSADHGGEKLDREREKRASPSDERALAVQCDGVECQSETRRRTQLRSFVDDITYFQPLGIRNVFNLASIDPKRELVKGV
jgi:hypothetical protein